MPLLRHPLEAIPCLLAMWTFISTSRPMAKTVVSAVKPGGQATRPCPSGFLICCRVFVLCGWEASPCARLRCGGGMRGQGVVAGAGCSWTALFQGTRWRLCGRTIPGKSWGGLLYIDNGGCSLEPWWRARSGGVRRREGCSACRLAWPCLVPDQSGGVTPRYPEARGPNPVKIALLWPWRASGTWPWPAFRPLPSKALCYPLDPCFHFFPAAKCPTHLK